MIKNTDCLVLMESLDDYSIDFIFGDPPYNLGSEVYIDPVDNKPKFKGSAKDFMSKWEFSHDQWEKYFKQAYRIQKYGAYHVLYGMDRQLFLVQYYAIAAGYEVCQSIYWYFTQSMPKAVDASKMIDAHYGNEREVVGKYQRPDGSGERTEIPSGTSVFGLGGDQFITAPACELSEQYDGHKYGIAPLKQCLETVMVFRKPCKNSTVIADIIASPQDSEITPSVINVDGERVFASKEDNEYDVARAGYKDGDSHITQPNEKWDGKCHNGWGFKGVQSCTLNHISKGRYPSQLYCTTQTAEILDKQSGVLKSGDKLLHHDNSYSVKNSAMGLNSTSIPKLTPIKDYKGDSGGCSRILHKCDYEKLDFYLLHYFSKASQSERHSGLENTKNIHPTVKPISLNTHIANLFKLPKGIQQTTLLPFLGSGSELIGLVKSGYNSEHIIASELSKEYLEIAQARIKYFTAIDVQIDGIQNDVKIDKYVQSKLF